MTTLAIGSAVWIFDGNRRRYENGVSVYSHHWERYEVVEENRVSWFVQSDGGVRYKVDKATNTLRLRDLYGKRAEIATSWQEVEDDIYIREQRHVIAKAVSNLSDAATLREVAHLLGVS